MSNHCCFFAKISRKKRGKGAVVLEMKHETLLQNNVTVKTIGDKEYIIKSVFASNIDIKAALLKLAERKAAREMGA